MKRGWLTGYSREFITGLLKTMPYSEYLQTPEWKDRRVTQMRSAKYKCQLCNNRGTLHVHHRTYERRGDETFKDLIVLCDECHERFHEKIASHVQM